MDPDDHVCLCFRVSLRKIANFIEREEPRVASQISDCLGAGTGCQWCVPFLKRLHALHAEGATMDLPVSPEEYASRRARYRSSGVREEGEQIEADSSLPSIDESSAPPPSEEISTSQDLLDHPRVSPHDHSRVDLLADPLDD